MKVKKMLCLLLALSALMGLMLSGCGKEPEPEKEPALADTEINSDFVIYNSADADNNTKQAALCLQTALLQNSRISLNIVTEKPSAKYIEVSTNSSLDDGAYEIKSYGDKIILQASDSYILVCAARDIREKWVTTEGAFSGGSAKLTVEQCATFSGAYNKANMPFVIMSQNILFKTDTPSPNTIPERSERFKKLLQEYQPDIIGAQEFGNWNAYYHLFMKQTYDMTDDSNGVPILYRKDRYSLVDTGKFYLSSTPEIPSKVEGSSGNRNGTWAILKDKMTDKEILVVSNHPCWTTDTVRDQEVKNLLTYLEDKINSNITFITGDFNTEPTGPVYKRVIDFGLKDSYVTAKENRSTVDYTCGFFDSGEYCRIDYIFHDDNSTAMEYKILNDMYGGFVSDHFGIVARFEFNN